jgi:hypothetical protein
MAVGDEWFEDGGVGDVGTHTMNTGSSNCY